MQRGPIAGQMINVQDWRTCPKLPAKALIRVENRGSGIENKRVTGKTFMRFRGRAARLEVNPMGESPIDRAFQWLS